MYEYTSDYLKYFGICKSEELDLALWFRTTTSTCCFKIMYIFAVFISQNRICT